MTVMFYSMMVRLTDGRALRRRFATMGECIEMKDKLINGNTAVSWDNTWINPRNVVTVHMERIL